MRYRLELDGGRALGVDSGRIVDPDGRFDLTLPAGAGELRPGLINAHDHLHRNHYPRLGDPPYPDAYAWGRDLHDRFAAEIERAKRLERADALLFGALKNLLGGATTVVHHDRREPVFERGFPVRVPRLRVAHSLRFEPDLDAAAAGDAATRQRPLCIHLAEGVNAAAAAEVREAADRGLLDERTLAVHAVGVDDEGGRTLRAAGAAVIWCPTSNAFLYGRTAPPALFRTGIDVLLGTDALLTGAGTPLDELRAARRTGRLGDERLLDTVGATAARRLGLHAPELAPGAPADLVLLRRPVFEAGAGDVALVVVGGEPRLADDRFGELFERAGIAWEELRVGAVRKRVAAPLASVARRVLALTPACARIFRQTAIAPERGAGTEARATP